MFHHSYLGKHDVTSCTLNHYSDSFKLTDIKQAKNQLLFTHSDKKARFFSAHPFTDMPDCCSLAVGGALIGRICTQVTPS